mgnify:CR=1 FL=1
MQNSFTVRQRQEGALLRKEAALMTGRYHEAHKTPVSDRERERESARKRADSEYNRDDGPSTVVKLGCLWPPALELILICSLSVCSVGCCQDPTETRPGLERHYVDKQMVEESQTMTERAIIGNLPQDHTEEEAQVMQRDV